MTPGPRPSYRSWLTLAGAALTTVSAVLFLVFFVLDSAGFHTSPYLGIVTFLVLPALFLAGLLLMPVGVWRQRRRAALGKPTAEWPTIDFRRPRVRRLAIVLIILTGSNVAIIAMAAYKSVEYVDSTAFCTGACHTPMEPQSVAHQRSVHANVGCASCHVGPGAPGFVTAKAGGVRRLAAIVTGDYARPVRAPVHGLPSAAGTCGSCHSPRAYMGERVRQRRYYSDDEENTEQMTTLTLRLGGGGWEAGGPHGIHWHASPMNQVEYIPADDSRTTIPWIRVTDYTGEVREYSVEGVSREELARRPRRIMDCTDCHNRVGHDTAESAERAVDRAIVTGLLPRSLPFVRRETLAALTSSEPVTGGREAAERRIAEHLLSFYAQDASLAGDPRVAQAVAAARRLYGGNVFPSMNVTWNTYPSNSGHTEAPGCFRCHDDQHTTPTGLVLSQDCESCHSFE